MADQNDLLPRYFQKNTQEAIGIDIVEWKGEIRIDIRTYVQPLGKAELVATKRGVSIPLKIFSTVMQGVRELANVMGPEKIVSQTPKSSREEIRIGVTTYRGTRLVYIRSFVYVDDEDPQWRPTRRGVSMRVELYPYLLEAFEEVEERLTD